MQILELYLGKVVALGANSSAERADGSDMAQVVFEDTSGKERLSAIPKRDIPLPIGKQLKVGHSFSMVEYKRDGLKGIMLTHDETAFPFSEAKDFYPLQI